MRPASSLLGTTSLQLALGLAAASAAVDAPQPEWLQQPCALLSSVDIARVLPAAEAAFVANPYVGRRESDCLWSDTEAGRSLRLVLHPAKDAARVTSQLQRQQSQDAGSVAFEAGAAAAVLSGDQSRLSIAVGNWMVSLLGSAPLDADAARALALELAKRVTSAAPSE